MPSLADGLGENKAGAMPASRIQYHAADGSLSLVVGTTNLQGEAPGTAITVPQPQEYEEEEPIYVNAKQYHCILRRREQRRRQEEKNIIVRRKVRAMPHAPRTGRIPPPPSLPPSISRVAPALT